VPSQLVGELSPLYEPAVIEVTVQDPGSLCFTAEAERPDVRLLAAFSE
jgi:hypothetical protein